MTGNEYNGWANYETWFVNLSLLNGTSLADYGCAPSDSVYDVRRALMAWMDDLLIADLRRSADISASIPHMLAQEFLSNVNWYELAQHMLDEETQDEETQDEETQDEETQDEEESA